MKNSNQHSTCLTEQELLAYIKREMTSDELRKAELHITDCELCGDAIDGLKLVQTDRSVEIITELKHTINKKLEGKVKSIGYNFNWIQIAAILFIIGLSAGSYIYIQRLSESNIALQNDNEPGKSSKLEVDTTNNIQQEEIRIATESEDISTAKPNSDFKIVTPENSTSYSNAAKSMNDVASISSDEITRESNSKTENAGTTSESISLNFESSKNIETAPTTAAPAKAEEKIPLIENENIDATIVNQTESTKDQYKLKQKSLSKDKKMSEAVSVNTTNFNTGKALYQTKKYDQALQQFDSVIKNKSDINHDEAIWICADIKIIQNKKEEARLLLEQLKDSAKYKNKAEKLLNKL